MNEELDLRQMFKFLYKRKKVLIYILLASILIGILYTFIIEKQKYEIKAQILIDKADASIENFMNSKDILKINELIVKFDRNTKVITITCNTEDKEKLFYEINDYIQNLEAKLTETYNIKIFNIFESPKMPEEPINIDHLKQIMICVGIGIIICIFYIMIMCKGVTNSLEIQERLKIKVLGKVNLEKNKNKKKYKTKNKITEEQFKRIHTNIQLNKDNKNPRTILVTGIKNKVGTTYITNNLANQYAKIYNNVLIIDADIINGTLTKNLLEEETEGLTDLLLKNEITDLNKKIYDTKNEKIQILPKGKENIGEEFFLKETIKQIIEELQKKYDVILIDCNDISKHTSPIVLTSIVDATVLVIELAKTREEEILKSKLTIENVNGKISGIILNKAM